MRRRDVLLGLGAALATACARAASVSPRAAEEDAFAALEASVGGRVGVHALDTGSGRHLGRREDERFAMCSTFKWALVAAVLAPIVIAAYLSDSHSSPEALAAAHAEIGRIVARALGPTAT